MQLSNQEAESLIRDGVAALQQGRPAEARKRFESVTQTGRASGQIWLLLAAACRAEADVAGEEAALDQLLVLEPRAVRGHIMKGDCRAKAGDDRAALNFYRSGLLIASGQQVPDDLLAELRRAEAAAAQLEARVEAEREAALARRGLPPDNRSRRFQRSLDFISGRTRIYLQEPTAYYFPELPQIQFFDAADFDWAPAVEAAASEVREEIERLLAAGTEGFRPYIQAEANRPRIDDNPLLDSPDWSALFLCENGRLAEEVIARCPKTWEAVQAAPLPRIANSPTVMFSLLRAGARIAPHTGMTNTRLTCHLPLIVPPECGFRVGNEVREWEEGKLLIFDDTIEHEAWNGSAQDRVVLIFDIWRPELSDRERGEVGALFSGPALD
ncbi:MAG TPA: aspartyl/asparaginyl beta-hydroxylase domain-containing protein [Allosphingosinicella sp.]|nr:aspartyl/asparaginyl beta-hydroxylase domain-containing protein [Allosphingosinicella sp.]